MLNLNPGQSSSREPAHLKPAQARAAAASSPSLCEPRELERSSTRQGEGPREAFKSKDGIRKETSTSSRYLTCDAGSYSRPGVPAFPAAQHQSFAAHAVTGDHFAQAQGIAVRSAASGRSRLLETALPTDLHARSSTLGEAAVRCCERRRGDEMDKRVLGVSLSLLHPIGEEQEDLCFTVLHLNDFDLTVEERMSRGVKMREEEVFSLGASACIFLAIFTGSSPRNSRGSLRPCARCWATQPENGSSSSLLSSHHTPLSTHTHTTHIHPSCHSHPRRPIPRPSQRSVRTAWLLFARRLSCSSSSSSRQHRLPGCRHCRKGEYLLLRMYFSEHLLIFHASLHSQSNSGHPGMPMGMAPIAHLLFSR